MDQFVTDDSGLSMTDSSDVPAPGGDDILKADRAPMFYVVSQRKLAILFLATFGLYAVYWFYKNWDRYKDAWPYASEVGSTIWPVPRAVFSVFFVHSLFRKIKVHGQDKPAVAGWSNNLDATLMVLFLLASSFLDRAANKSLGSPYTDWLSLAILAPLLFQFVKAQEMINLSCGDPGGESNSGFCKANYAWTVCGGLFWILVLIGFILPN
jgi:hypothetical protein